MEDQVRTVSRWLVVVGAVVWGLVGIGGFAGTNLNVVELALGQSVVGTAAVQNLVYLLVGAAGLYEVYRLAQE